MNRLMGMALVTAGMGVCAITSALAQVTFRIDASIPPGIARELKRHGIAMPTERVRGTFEIRDTVRDGIQVRFQEAEALKRSRDGRVEVSEPAAPSMKVVTSPALTDDVSSPPPAKALQPSWVDAAPEASVPSGCFSNPIAPKTCPDVPASPDTKVVSLPAAVPTVPDTSVPAAPKAPIASGPMGEWTVADGSARIGIHSCGANFCGTVTLAKEKDRVGERILRDMKPDGENRWRGTILDPRSGKIYQSTMTLKGSSLRVDGCVMGFLCGGETWTRG
jgi:uncharacterized protein (DUF2147 family)